MQTNDAGSGNDVGRGNEDQNQGEASVGRAAAGIAPLDPSGRPGDENDRLR